jgi:dGTP triphosphohydrolase
MTTKKHKLVKGSIASEGDQSPTLDVLVARMEAMDQNQRMIALNMAELAEANTTNQALLQQVLKERRATDQALTAAMSKLQEVAEQRPTAPETMEAMLKHASEMAKENARAKRIAFNEVLENAPKGQIHNYDTLPVEMSINGHYFVVMPGPNKDVPAPFVEVWEQRLDDLDHAAQITAQIQGSNRFVDLERWRAARRGNDYNAQHWDENMGVSK